MDLPADTHVHSEWSWDAGGPVPADLHTLQIGEDRSEPGTLYRVWAPDDVVTAYLREVPSAATSGGR